MFFIIARSVRRKIQGPKDFSLVVMLLRSIAIRTPDGVQMANYYTAELFTMIDARYLQNFLRQKGVLFSPRGLRLSHVGSEAKGPRST